MAPKYSVRGDSSRVGNALSARESSFRSLASESSLAGSASSLNKRQSALQSYRSVQEDGSYVASSELEHQQLKMSARKREGKTSPITPSQKIAVSARSSK